MRFGDDDNANWIAVVLAIGVILWGIVVVLVTRRV
jgi:hypothetical protein